MFPIPNRRLSKRLYRLEVPTSIIMAGSDHLVVEGYGAAWAQAVPHAEVVTIEGAGHLINLEAPEVLATAITDLLHR
jgi:pimeloyl-ACP methyl ester carboxylesterase